MSYEFSGGVNFVVPEEFIIHNYSTLIFPVFKAKAVFPP